MSATDVPKQIGPYEILGPLGKGGMGAVYKAMQPSLDQRAFAAEVDVTEELKEAGVPPSFDEMKDALDFKSKSGIHRLITELHDRAATRRTPLRLRPWHRRPPPLKQSARHGPPGANGRSRLGPIHGRPRYPVTWASGLLATGRPWYAYRKPDTNPICLTLFSMLATEAP